MEKLNMPETVAHHAMALTGGFFGVYALLLRSENFGSSETANLIYLFAAGLGGNWGVMRIRLGAMFVYIAGLVAATLLPKCFKDRDFRYAAIAIDAVCVLILARIPADVHPILALYPMFFAMAVQWLAFTSASGFNSATVFSTNNTRQMVAGLTEFICTRDRAYLLRFKFFAGALVCFHIGVVYGYFCLKKWGIPCIYASLVLIAIAALCTHLARRAKQEEQRSAGNGEETAERGKPVIFQEKPLMKNSDKIKEISSVGENHKESSRRVSSYDKIKEEFETNDAT